MIQTTYGGLLTILKELQVDKIVISKQGKDSENYQIFKELAKNKKIYVVKKRRWNWSRKRYKASNTMV